MTNRLFVFNKRIGFYLEYVLIIQKPRNLAVLKLVSADNQDITTDAMNIELINQLYKEVISAVQRGCITFDLDYQINELLGNN